MSDKIYYHTTFQYFPDRWLELAEIQAIAYSDVDDGSAGLDTLADNIEQSLNNVMNQLFRGVNVSFSIVDNHIVLSAKSNKEDQQKKTPITVSGTVTDSKGEPPHLRIGDMLSILNSLMLVPILGVILVNC